MKTVKIELSLEPDMYDQLIHISNQLNMNAFDLIRSLISYTVKEYGNKS